MPKINKLTPQQEALISTIRDEWIKIALDTSPIDKEKAEAAILLVYKCAGVMPPKKILWFDNPYAALEWIVANNDDIGHFFTEHIWDIISALIGHCIKADVNVLLKMKIKSDCSHSINQRIQENIYIALLKQITDIFDEDVLTHSANNYKYQWNDIVEDVTINYCESILRWGDLAFYAYLDAIGVDCSKLKGCWEAAKHCGLWWSFKEVAVATPKPSVIRLDSEGRLHGEGEPVIVYEGLSLYAYHGVILPEKYGKLHPNQWRSQWLLEEDNAEVRRVLIQRIGYERICQELGATELDSWHEYTLIKIDNADVEPIYLLKMTCPSTGFIHVLRVPPEDESAREAIRWINWGIEPDDFAVQT